MQSKEASGRVSSRTIEWSVGIEGMTCASCVLRIEKSLRAIPGVIKANVSLAAKSAQIEMASNVTMYVIQQAVERAGYKLVQQEVDLDVAGMTCASCVNRVEKALTQLTGVIDVNI